MPSDPDSRANSLSADVAVIGGGPSGSATAIYLARAGLKVILFEREQFPRFRIGESLLPLNLPILEELGLAGEMDRRFIRKYAANFADRWGRRQARYPFGQGVNRRYQYAYEVERAEFDQMLLDHAASQGADVRTGWAVREVLWENDRAVGLRAEPVGARAALTVNCPMIVDASGRSAFLGTRLGMKRDLSFQTRTAFFAHFDGAHRDPGEREGDIQIVSFPHGWFWMIPFKGNVTSVGAVVTDDYLKSRYPQIVAAQRAAKSAGHDDSNDAVAGKTEAAHDVFLRETIEATDYVAKRLDGATQKWSARSIANFSFVMDRYAGNGYVLLGDAGAFLDPVFSTGVFLSMKSAQVASNAIRKCHRLGDYSVRHFRSYEKRIRAAQAIFFRFIRGWYDPAFVDLFFYSRNFLGLRTAIISVLSADLFDWRYLWSLKLRISAMFLMANLHRQWLRRRRGGRSLVQRLPV